MSQHRRAAWRIYGAVTVSLLLSCISHLTHATGSAALDTLARTADARHARASARSPSYLRVARTGTLRQRDANAAPAPQLLLGKKADRYTGQADVGVERPARVDFAIRWQPPSVRLQQLARKFRRTGLPVLRLWESRHSVLAIGLSPRGVPGLYFTRTDQD
jgi:hypothetical protein